MKIASVALIAPLCILTFGCKSPVAVNGDYWQSKASQIAVGMTRAEVEKLLPRHPRSPMTTVVTGGSQSVRYWVDENWSVNIAYDYTGVPRDARGTALDVTSPHNKVLTVAALKQSKMPAIEVKSIGTIEQQRP